MTLQLASLFTLELKLLSHLFFNTSTAFITSPCMMPKLLPIPLQLTKHFHFNTFRHFHLNSRFSFIQRLHLKPNDFIQHFYFNLNLIVLFKLPLQSHFDLTLFYFSNYVSASTSVSNPNPFIYIFTSASFILYIIYIFYLSAVTAT